MLIGRQFYTEQLALITNESLLTQPVGTFEPATYLAELEHMQHVSGLAIDIGGDSLEMQAYEVQGSRAVPQEEPRIIQSAEGKEYLLSLEQAADDQSEVVGISIAGVVEGTRVTPGTFPNSPAFEVDLARHDFDIANIFKDKKKLTLLNDAVAGLLASTIYAQEQHPQAKNVLYLINGSGIGGAVYHDSEIIAIEPCEVPLIPELNVHGRESDIRANGEQYVSSEAVAASKLGIEALWKQLTGSHLSGKEISTRCNEGDPLARELYSNSARIVGHLVAGILTTLELEPSETVLIGHGGCFKATGYKELVGEVLLANSVEPLAFTSAYHFSANACLAGAAIGAILPPNHLR